MSAIIDSNVTTALTALILYVVGTESVQGFAITLLDRARGVDDHRGVRDAHVLPRVGETSSEHDDAQALHL